MALLAYKYIFIFKRKDVNGQFLPRLEERFHYRVVRTENNDKTTPRTIIFFERGKDNDEEIEKLEESFWNKVSFPKKLLQELPETYI